MVFYLVFQPRFARSVNAGILVQAFAVRVLLFLPIYFLTFVAMNLLAYPGPVVDRGTISPLGGIIDMRSWAIALRIPYSLAMMFALWKVTPQFRAVAQEAPSFEFEYPPDAAEHSPLIGNLDLYAVRCFFFLMVGAGLLNAMIAAVLLCRLPDPHVPTFTSLFIRAVVYVAVGMLAGMGGAWFYWNRPSSPFRGEPPLPFSLFALVCAAGWAWVPAMVILYDEVSPAAPVVAMIGAFVMAAGLRRATYFLFAPSHGQSSFQEPEETELFAESLYRAPREAHGYVITICLYAGAYALIAHSNLTASALLALCACLFAWKKTFVPSHHLRTNAHRRARRRLALVVIPAVLVTIWALLDGVAHRNHSAQIEAALAAGESSSAGPDSSQKSQHSKNGVGGYESIILWPIPEKKQIIPPLPTPTSLFALGTSRPVVIRFDGPYWYVQPPDQRPGPTAHQAHGTPLAVNIKAENFIPLTMEAHQSLGRSIRFSRCREIQVEVESRDNEPGEVSMSVLLSDSSAPGSPRLTLGEQTLISNDLGHPSFRAAPIFKTVSFSVPAHAPIRKFDEIAVELIPDVEHAFVAPKIAIQQFQLLPR